MEAEHVWRQTQRRRYLASRHAFWSCLHQKTVVSKRLSCASAARAARASGFFIFQELWNCAATVKSISIKLEMLTDQVGER